MSPRPRTSSAPSKLAPANRRRALLGVAVALAAGLLVPSAAPAQAQAPAGEGRWFAFAPLSAARYDHTATLLGNGRVLAAGGVVPGPAGRSTMASSEVLDPVVNRWRSTGAMATPRWRHTATLLEDGRVLVAGGFGDYLSGSNAQPVLDSAEIYDPATGTWTPTDSLSTRRALHTATLLEDGRVLVAGGRTCDQPPPTACNFTFRSDSAEIYDPATGTWTPTDSLEVARHTTGAARLDDGRVLVPAGFTPDGPGTTAETYDPDTGSWTPTGDLNEGRARQGAVLLPDGEVLVTAGFPGRASAERYDPGSDAWSLAGTVLAPGRFNFNTALLPNGKVLVAGGAVPGQGVSRSSEVYDPAAASWSSAGDMAAEHGSGSSLSNTDPAIVLSGDPFRYAPDPRECANRCGAALVIGNNPTGAVDLYLGACPAVPPRPTFACIP